ncbi:N-terminal nucleophile aminohydrolase [Hortaea werneckii]|nr:N-terminal nucleophile aminohydrolase [Hortaea werneckii]
MHLPMNEKPPPVRPRIIIHGGAGNINPANLPPNLYATYRHALLKILRSASSQLHTNPTASALDVAASAVTDLENNPLFNSGHGAVFTTQETHELEASIMCSDPVRYRKRGVGVMKVGRVKNPILVAKAMLERGNEEDGGGAQGHVQLEGETCEELAGKWGLEMVRPSYFWTRKRWDEHRRGLGLESSDKLYREHRRRVDRVGKMEEVEDEDDIAGSLKFAGGEGDEGFWAGDVSWDGKEYLPQGTVGAVVLDRTGMTCVATSTGGITNKLPGRIGDTPTLGAGFWAEEWETIPQGHQPHRPMQTPTPTSPLASLTTALSACLPTLTPYLPLPTSEPQAQQTPDSPKPVPSTPSKRAIAISGTGNGDSFLRLSATRTAAAQAQYRHPCSTYPLQACITSIAGPGGKLQQSAAERWGRTGEGEGGMIGIDFLSSAGVDGRGGGGKGEVVADFNCGGMFRAWEDERGEGRMAVFREEGDGTGGGRGGGMM